MKTQTTHTPTPWKRDTKKPWSLKDSLGNHFLSLSTPHERQGEFEANAAYIVKCVNSHEELTQKVYEAYHTFLNGGKPEKWWLKEVEALLAKAEGKE